MDTFIIDQKRFLVNAIFNFKKILLKIKKCADYFLSLTKSHIYDNIYVVISMKKFLLYDDSEAAVSEMKELLEAALGDTEHKIFTASRMEAADRILETENIDAAFLDIVLENGNGINYAVNIQSRFPKLQVIFVTGYVMYSEHIFDAQPSGFLIKPVTLNKIKRVLDQLSITGEESDSGVLVYSTKESGVMSFPFAETGYFEYSHRKIYIFTPEGKEVGSFPSSVGEFESKLPPYFQRCHYSFWINLALTKEICRYQAITIKGTVVPISQNRFMNTREAYVRYLTKKM